MIQFLKIKLFEITK